MVLTPLASQGKADSETHAMPGLRGPAPVFDYHTFMKYVTLFLKDEHDLWTNSVIGRNIDIYNTYV